MYNGETVRDCFINPHSRHYNKPTIVISRYGLILPGKDKKPAPSANFGRPSVFGSDSDSDEDQKPSKVGLLGPGEAQKRQARLQQEKAMEEDPTIFQYDELYEDMETKRKEEITEKKKAQPQGPKYIKKLLETADKRKKEYERRIERQVQKERDEEGEQFKDKESFVTSSYKKKLEEMKAAEDEEKKAEYLESIGDVQKQNNLDGFYRHLYAQKTGDVKEAPSTAKISVPDEKPSVAKKERHYRKRDSGQEQKEEEEEKVTPAGETEEAIKTHIASNLDADSDFSIDSSDSEDEAEKDGKNPAEKKDNEVSVDKKEDDKDNFKAPNVLTTDLKKPEEAVKSEDKIDDKDEDDVIEEPAPKKVKIDIWAKRTVGDVFDEAVQRYFERKAARAGG